MSDLALTMVSVFGVGGTSMLTLLVVCLTITMIAYGAGADE